ncbi:MAG: hypothetical protein IJI68_01215 [Eggerthellaceae bacterium]|nr:hypothetical protein [Eggerthellaceae bacterium]
MIDSMLSVIDALDDVVLDVAGASDALSYWATIDGDELAAMLSRVLGEDADRLREAARWLEENGGDLRVLDELPASEE